MKLRIVQLTLISILASACITGLSAQSTDSVSIVKKFDELVLKWDLLAVELGQYEGLDKYCTDKSYQDNVIKTLEEIHHYDTLLYQTLAKKARYDKSAEIKKTLKQIEEFETEYKGPSFLKKLHDECVGRREIEKDYKETRNDIGMNSYDGQVLVLEADLNKYVQHITRLMDHIEEHIHHLHLE
ncbi:MAG: hypothetical protein ACMVP2_27250 [Imperialibacter sp.]|uniref:hypothetical protein n=1 Tax=Imperialibacter sp. TaxID=2038411 RepID=UPI0030DB5262|tara:strand:- start:299 stop:850 length:552 start_codon:yes stop_codon:yes gene_type:complete